MTDSFTLLSAFLVGLLGGVHCVGMCGGIVSALTLGLDEKRRTSLAGQMPFHLAYNTGRLISYTLAGALMGGIGLMLAQFMPVQVAQRMLLGLAGLFMILLGLYLGGWWMALTRLEKTGGLLWRRIEPLGRGLLPVRSPRHAILLGLLWGWLPCGLVYSVLIWSVSAGGVMQGALLMLFFGLGTLPNLLAMGAIAGKLVQFMRRPLIRQIAGALVILLGGYNLWQAF